jgi:hypothetical protein
VRLLPHFARIVRFAVNCGIVAGRLSAGTDGSAAVASAGALLAVIDLADGSNMLLVEAYLAETPVGAAEPSATAPPAAGGAL